MYFEIKNSLNWEKVEEIRKGWSADRKYYVVANTGERLLLRISDIEKLEEKKKEYAVIGKYASLGFTMSRPVDFGVCAEGKNVYMLLTWVEGCDLEEVLPELNEKEQYALGRRAGEILRKIHSLPISGDDLPKKTKKEKKLEQLSRYEACSHRVAGDGRAIEYVKNNIDLIWREHAVYQHGDFHPGNLIISDEGELGVIDFNRWEVGDPYEEFYKLESFGTEISIPYCIGQIDSYFEDNIPHKFWETLAVYVAHASLFSIKWAEKFGQKDIDGMIERCSRAFSDYDFFTRCVPKWYTDKWSEERKSDGKRI